MGKGKLKKFSEMENFPNVLQPSFREVFGQDYAYKGRWKEFFGNDRPVMLELGCGKGEYTTGMARMFPENNYIGVDIKGSRIWTGARLALDEGLANVAFIRTSVEVIGSFFGSGEISGIWIAFPDPQVKKRRRKKRLTAARFLNEYRKFLVSGGTISLKTDNALLYRYTLDLLEGNGAEIISSTEDLYAAGDPGGLPGIMTYYEQQYLGEGRKIHFLSFRLPAGEIEETGHEGG